MAVLVLAEHDNRQLAPATGSLLAAARLLAPPVHVLVAGHACDTVAESAARLAGVAKVFCAQAPHYTRPTAENLTRLMAGLAREHSHVVGAATARGKGTLPRLAATLGVAPVSNIVRIIDANTFERPVHAGRLLATVHCAEPVVVMGIAVTAFPPAHTTQPPAPIVAVAAPEDCGLSCIEAVVVRNTDRPALAHARIIVAGGRGFDTVEDFHRLLGPLAQQLGAAIGATRAAVDQGIPNDCQIGQSAHTVAPDLYIAIGISGAVQHMSGVRGSKVLVAINKDERAPICQQADYVLIANLYKAVPKLTEAIGSLASGATTSKSASAD